MHQGRQHADLATPPCVLFYTSMDWFFLIRFPLRKVTGAYEDLFMAHVAWFEYANTDRYWNRLGKWIIALFLLMTKLTADVVLAGACITGFSSITTSTSATP
jgi:hypothetical protein